MWHKPDPTKTKMNVLSGSAPTKDKDVADSAFVPGFYYVSPVYEKLSVGGGAFSNFGFSTEYDRHSAVAPVARHTDVKSVNLNTSLAYEIHGGLSVGLGVNAVYVEGELDTCLPASAFALLKKTGTLMGVSGDDWGYGWNVGIFWEPFKGTRIGASYRSKVDATLKGKAKSDVFTQGDYDFAGKGSVDLPCHLLRKSLSVRS